MKVLVTGSTGLIGSRVCAHLVSSGHAVHRLVRSQPDPAGGKWVWDPTGGTLDSKSLEGVDAVIHLAGENVAKGRWTEEKKKNIRESRVRSTRLLSDTLAASPDKPKTFICASAIGFYGDRGDEVLTEESPPGTGFFPEVCQDWEEATRSAAEAGIRVANVRIGVVLSPDGGALREMLFPFRLGLGGRLGSGRQYMSWISLPDVVGGISHVLNHAELKGPVNLMAPNPVSNLEFTKTLGRVLRRPTLFPVPSFVLRLVLGEMAENLLLAGTRAVPRKLLESGYSFRHPQLEEALRFLLGK